MESLRCLRLEWFVFRGFQVVSSTRVCLGDAMCWGCFKPILYEWSNWRRPKAVNPWSASALWKVGLSLSADVTQQLGVAPTPFLFSLLFELIFHIFIAFVTLCFTETASTPQTTFSFWQPDVTNGMSNSHANPPFWFLWGSCAITEYYKMCRGVKKTHFL